MQEPPKEKSLYIHTLIFSKNNGINNNYAYFPDAKALLGYIQYSFLQEAFYKWIYGKDRMVTKIPSKPVSEIVNRGLLKGLITKETAELMLSHYNRLERMWEIPKDRLVRELMKFTREFNKTWFGNNKEFLYIKLFKNPLELGEFVVESVLITKTEKQFEDRVGVTVDEWKNICKKVNKDKESSRKFQKIIIKKLSEVI